MNIQLFAHARRRLLVLTVAALLALAATYAPVMLDGTTGSAMTTTTYACGGPQTGGGDC